MQNYIKLLTISLIFITTTCIAQETLKVSHRGYPENTVVGAWNAFLDGYPAIEVDVRLRNGVAVLLHDDIPCSNCDTLSSLLNFARNYNMTVFAEIKESAVVQEAANVVNKSLADVILISYGAGNLTRLNSMTNYPLGLITYDGQNIPGVESFIDWIVINKAHADKCDDYPNLKCAVGTIVNQAEFNTFNGTVDALIMDQF